MKRNDDIIDGRRLLIDKSFVLLAFTWDVRKDIAKSI